MSKMEINISKVVLRFVMVATLAFVVAGVTPAGSVLADTPTSPEGGAPVPCPGPAPTCVR
jgi:hypothetical protein